MTITEDDVFDPDAPEHPNAVRAKIRGRCSECSDPIEVDDWIVPNHQGGWIHDECG
jgi:hypothetical protein